MKKPEKSGISLRERATPSLFSAVLLGCVISAAPLKKAEASCCGPTMEMWDQQTMTWMGDLDSWEATINAAVNKLTASIAVMNATLVTVWQLNGGQISVAEQAKVGAASKVADAEKIQKDKQAINQVKMDAAKENPEAHGTGCQTATIIETAAGAGLVAAAKANELIYDNVTARVAYPGSAANTSRAAATAEFHNDWLKTYCDPSQFGSIAGCGGSGENIDADVRADTLFGRSTYNPAWQKSVKDYVFNVTGGLPHDPIPVRALGSATGKVGLAEWRRIMALRSIVDNSFAYISSMRAEGVGGSKAAEGIWLNAAYGDNLEALGGKANAVALLKKGGADLPAKLSKYQLMEVAFFHRFTNKVWYKQQIDEPANVFMNIAQIKGNAVAFKWEMSQLMERWAAVEASITALEAERDRRGTLYNKVTN